MRLSHMLAYLEFACAKRNGAIRNDSENFFMCRREVRQVR